MKTGGKQKQINKRIMPVVLAGIPKNGTFLADQFFLLMYEKCVLNTLDSNLHL